MRMADRFNGKNGEVAVGDAAVALTERLWGQLKREPERVQGAVTADLVALWIAQHRAVPAAEQGAVDEELLQIQLDFIRQLLSYYRQGAGGVDEGTAGWTKN